MTSPFDVIALLELHKDFKNAVTMATSQNINDQQKTYRIITRKVTKAKLMHLNDSKDTREKPNGEGVEGHCRHWLKFITRNDELLVFLLHGL